MQEEYAPRGKPFLLGSGGILLIISFFMPWLSVSCAGVNLASVSGADLAARLGPASDPLFYFVPVAGLVACLAAAYFVYEPLAAKRGGGPGGLLATAACIPLVLKVLGSFVSQPNNPFASMVTVSPQIGLIAVVLGILATAASTQAD